MYNNRLIQLLTDLVSFPSVSPSDEGSIDYLKNFLEGMGFICTKCKMGVGAEETTNLYAILKRGPFNLCFVGHVDVVPPGQGWSYNPFSLSIHDDVLYGRGLTDMKGPLACFLTAIEQTLDSSGEITISLLLTSDEEATGKFGIKPFLAYLIDNSLYHATDLFLVGESTSEVEVADTLTIGRRGSANFRLTVNGVQGHVARPGNCVNPVHELNYALHQLIKMEFRDGDQNFPASALQVTSIDVNNGVSNLIPHSATARFNVRFGPSFDANSLFQTIEQIIGENLNCSHELKFLSPPSLPFFTDPNNPCIRRLAKIIEEGTRSFLSFSTAGGTSDGRFVFHLAPTVELGLCHQMAHASNECASYQDLNSLLKVYCQVIANIASE